MENNEMLGQFVVIQLIDDIEEAVRKGKDQGLNKKIIEGGESLQDELRGLIMEMGTDEHDDELHTLMEGTVMEFIRACDEGKEKVASEKLQYLLKRVKEMRA